MTKKVEEIILLPCAYCGKEKEVPKKRYFQRLKWGKQGVVHRQCIGKYNVKRGLLYG